MNAMPRYLVAADTRSITAMNGSIQGYEPERYIDARETSTLRRQQLSSFQSDRSPFFMREQTITQSRRSMTQKLNDFDVLFAAASR